MFNVKKWAETSPLVALVTLAAGAIACTLTAANAGIDLFSKIGTLRTHPVVQIVGADFGDDKFDQVFVKISNPRSNRESFANPMLECDRQDGRQLLSSSLNDVADSWGLAKKIRRTPINVEGGGAEIVVLLFPKSPLVHINEQCQKILVVWSNSAAELLKGEPLQVPRGVTGFQNIELKPGWPN